MIIQSLKSIHKDTLSSSNLTFDEYLRVWETVSEVRKWVISSFLLPFYITHIIFNDHRNSHNEKGKNFKCLLIQVNLPHHLFK